jgi:HAD superfamily 5'-nucleotidase-like hydrolase
LEPLDPNFLLRGIVYDIKAGNFLKLSENGTIFRASHGTKFLTDKEIVQEYGESRHWPQFEEMIENVNNLGDDIRIFENFFDMPIMMVCARIVDIVDKKNGGRPEKYSFWQDVFASAQHTYLHLQFANHGGGFFPAWKEDTAKYVAPCNESVKRWLQNIKKSGRKLFILTSSFNDYAIASMKHILGNDWQTYFDLVMTFARKPSFFKQSRPFLKVENGSEKDPVNELNGDSIYSQGNYDELMKNLVRITGKSDPKVLFFGDSLRSDVFPAKRYANWETVLILEEMLAEQHCFEPEADVEPSGKKKKVEEPSDLEKVYLSSTYWGSFFTDTIPERVAKSDKTSNINNESKNYMNTLWGYIVRKYADVAIPQLEYVSDLCLTHCFEVFNHEEAFQWGFYPGLPKALEK